MLRSFEYQTMDRVQEFRNPKYKIYILNLLLDTRQVYIDWCDVDSELK